MKKMHLFLHRNTGNVERRTSIERGTEIERGLGVLVYGCQQKYGDSNVNIIEYIVYMCMSDEHGVYSLEWAKNVDCCRSVCIGRFGVLTCVCVCETVLTVNSRENDKI